MSRLELKDLQHGYDFDRKFDGPTLHPMHLIRLTLSSGHVVRYWNSAVGMSALKNPGGVIVEILAFAEEAV